MSEDLVNLAQRWPERHATHYEGCEADHVGCLVKKLAREMERLTSERDAAQAEVERLRVNGQETRDSSRPTDEDIWREVFLRCISDYITADRRVIVADTMLAEYRKRWPR